MESTLDILLGMIVAYTYWFHGEVESKAHSLQHVLAVLRRNDACEEGGCSGNGSDMTSQVEDTDADPARKASYVLYI